MSQTLLNTSFFISLHATDIPRVKKKPFARIPDEKRCFSCRGCKTSRVRAVTRAFTCKATRAEAAPREFLHLAACFSNCTRNPTKEVNRWEHEPLTLQTRQFLRVKKKTSILSLHDILLPTFRHNAAHVARRYKLTESYINSGLLGMKYPQAAFDAGGLFFSL